ncbi:hypothetical protein CC1G_04167 [Coprinopsis cinerea okayama7|uniref:DUF1996 domain-containing protein n=1 Tax=Coprinopsis cinerea (strain Okayama-7 / 130 / ATCC MYA-4618 / FGSC 9003) TaxID=240176 RepID=A8NW82_COPC7|nr:hypothetical protein CC1G_04167 [Coprinopsis cinerea okayama7\|eukprot:XP_001836854.2 hypothetical protein CC1G_04167 [Coprinopsis cinerea okayama7\
MSWLTLITIGFSLPSVQALFDPLVTPGEVSPHVHQIIGGNAFNLTMHPDLDIPNVATCTTCRFKENKSNYWTAVMYFKHPNGSFARVPQIPNHFTGNYNGGMTVYYSQAPSGSPRVTAFPKGFRMITGNPMHRRNQNYPTTRGEAWALSFRCWQTTGPFDYSNSHAIGPGPFDTINLPDRPCPGGIRSNTFFPTCWDGVNTDSPDHSSHVSFFESPADPRVGLFVQMNGKCPDTHPVHIPQLFFETVWDTRPFNTMWPEDGSQPFVLSMGDPTGYGHHGDYLFGWEDGALQRAMDNCLDIFGRPEDCTELTLQTDEEMNACTLPSQVDEQVEGGYLPELPGCNPVQHGPDPATMVPDCTAISTTGVAAAARATPPPT